MALTSLANPRRSVGPGPAQLPLLASAARTATTTTDEFAPGAHTGAITVAVVATASADTPSVVFSIEMYVEATDSWVSVLAGTALTGAGNKILTIGPSVPTAANASLTMALPPILRVVATAADADSLTYSVTIFAS